jgi:hypothetical protein
MRYLFLLGWLISCSAVNKDDKEILKKAAEVHNRMVEQAEQLEIRIGNMESDSSYSALSDSLIAWKEAVAHWESDLVEVPGNEEHHHKEGNHHHEHQQLNVTALQMLTIQQELHSRLQAIQLRVNIVTKKD